MASQSGAQIIAKAIHDLGVTVFFGIVGIPVVEIADEAIKLGVRFIAFRNEQAAGYAATAYGYLTGRPGVCLVVGGPGVLHAVAGVGNSTANTFPLLLLAGSSETHLVTKGAFQELDAVSYLRPHARLAIRPSSLDSTPTAIEDAYRAAWYGRPSTAFVDFPADLIQGKSNTAELAKIVADAPKSGADQAKLFAVAHRLKTAKAPLIVIGKGAAYARSEIAIREFVDNTRIPFLPTPMGKGVVADSHPLNTASARSAALRHADVVLLIGARLNWILHFGDTPKWSASVTFIQVDISADEIGRNGGDAALGLVGDIGLITTQLTQALRNWSYSSSSPYLKTVATSTQKNLAAAATKASQRKIPLTFQRAFEVIKNALHSLSPPEDGGIVYVSEGANTMDISRSAFPLAHPRLRLDAGTYATMGVGLGYAIAAHAAYNYSAGEGRSGPAGRKKIVCLEGDSAFGFSAMEIETMARYGMDVLVFVMNNSGVYHGDADDAPAWEKLRQRTVQGDGSQGLRSTSLGWEVRYEMLATMCGGEGYFVRDEKQLEEATMRGFQSDKVTIVNVVIEPGKGNKLEFGWQASARKEAKL